MGGGNAASPPFSTAWGEAFSSQMYPDESFSSDKTNKSPRAEQELPLPSALKLGEWSPSPSSLANTRERIISQQFQQTVPVLWKEEKCSWLVLSCTHNSGSWGTRKVPEQGISLAVMGKVIWCRHSLQFMPTQAAFYSTNPCLNSRRLEQVGTSTCQIVNQDTAGRTNQLEKSVNCFGKCCKCLMTTGPEQSPAWCPKQSAPVMPICPHAQPQALPSIRSR